MLKKNKNSSMAMFSINFKHLKREESTREKKSEKEIRIKHRKKKL